MRPCRIALPLLLASCVAFASARPAFAEPDKDADLAARVKQLEKRVADLEEALKKIDPSSAKASRTELENALIGVWELTDVDKKQLACTDMKLNGDGTCDLVAPPGGLSGDGKYKVVGKELSLSYALGGGAGSVCDYRVVSVSDKELVLETKVGKVDDYKVVKAHYTRVK
jgi:hypothetical protein